MISFDINKLDTTITDFDMQVECTQVDQLIRTRDWCQKVQIIDSILTLCLNSTIDLDNLARIKEKSNKNTPFMCLASLHVY